MRLRSFVPLLFALLVACDARPTPPPAPGAALSSAPAPGPERATYVEVLTGGATLGEALPLIVGLHGLGDRPERFIGMLADLDRKTRLVAMRGVEPYHGGFSWFTFTGKVGDPASIPGVRRSAAVVADTVAALVREHPTPGKPIVVGFSQGGVLAYALATRHGAAFSAAFPVGAFLQAPLWDEALAAHAPPIEAFHGEADPLVTLDLATGTRDGLAARGIPVVLHTYPGVPHGVPESVRRELFVALRRAVDQQAQAPAAP